jgi:hypothetical protein
MRRMKNCLASWRHSADTATNEHRSKVIAGRIRDIRRARIGKLRGANTKNMKLLRALAAKI